jgi:hypothetical protein
MNPLLLIAALPWVQGMTDAMVTDSAAPGVPAWFADDGDTGCAAEVQPPLRLLTGNETITVTYTGGLHVANAEGFEIASSAGYPCTGSADALEALAVGSVFGERTIVLTFTSGGRNEQWTWLGVYRIGFAGSIDPLFAGVVEHREDGIVRTGKLTFIPGALIYRPPGAHETLWVFDPVAHAYTPRGPFAHEPVPHS